MKRGEVKKRQGGEEASEEERSGESRDEKREGD